MTMQIAKENPASALTPTGLNHKTPESISMAANNLVQHHSEVKELPQSGQVFTKTGENPTVAELLPVAFHGDSLFIVPHEDEPFTPMKPIVSGMGMDWPTQYRKLTANQERWGVVILTIPTAGDGQQAVCMPLRKLPAYLGSISPNKVKAGLRDKIRLYQNECDDVLWKYWTGQQVKREPAPLPAPLTITPDQQKTLQDIVKTRIDALDTGPLAGKHYAAMWSRFKNHFGIPRYNELPQSRMTEAIQYLMSLELEPNQKALPPAPTFDVVQRRRELDAALYGVSEALRRFTADFNHSIPHKAYPHAPRQISNVAKLVDSALESIHCQVEVATRAVNVAMDVFEDGERRL